MDKYELREVNFEYNFKNGRICGVTAEEIYNSIAEYENYRTLEIFDTDIEAMQCMYSYIPYTHLDHYATSFLTGTAYIVIKLEYDDNGELNDSYTIDWNVAAYDPND